MSRTAIVDTGPLVAFLDASDQHHAWAVDQFKTLAAPTLTCEAVIAEAFFILRRLRPAQAQLLDWISAGVLQMAISLEREADAIASLWSRYEDVPMSLADACLVRMAELNRETPVFTLDSDFVIYRLRGKDPVPLIAPQ